jgi:exonuclease III
MTGAFNDFSILAWNVRGFANRKSWTHMHDLVNRYKPDVIFLFETHTSFASAERFWAREGYDKIGILEAQGHSGGIWAVQRQGNGYVFFVVSLMQ